MRLLKYKKWLAIFIGSLFLVGLLYLLSIYYLLTNGFRNYEKFCTHFIPQIESYKSERGVYPQTILNFEKPFLYWRYDAAQCNYIADPESFSFQISDGFIGIGIYLSTEKRWVYD